MKNENRPGIMTLAIHAGEQPDPSTRATSPNLVMSTTFIADPETSFSVEGMTGDAPYIYTRWGNPTVSQLERKLSVLENSEECIAFASGMAAVSALFFYLLSTGDHIIVSDVSYAATAEMTNELLPRMGIDVTKTDMSDPESVRKAVTPKTRLIYCETPCNPILRLTDIGAISLIAKDAGIKLAVDSTFATPLATRPLDLGADYVIHSLSKYIGGHGDAIGGALLGSKKELSEMRKKTAIRTGGILSPFNAWLILRGAATLPLRMKAHEQGALHVAEFLEKHPSVKRVIYPGLPSHPQYGLASRQMKNYSGMITFQVDKGFAASKILAGELKFIHYAVSLGHHRSLIFYLPTKYIMETSFHLDGQQRESYENFAGKGIFRLSVGLEDPADLCSDLGNALSLIG